jgi:thiamine transport system substrate-binding protein
MRTTSTSVSTSTSMPRSLSTVLALLLAALALALVACDRDGDATPAAPGERAELVVITHDSFDANEEVIAQFEAEHNARVTILKAGDANTLVNRAILSAGNPEGDVLFGVDNLTLLRARDAGVFEEYEAARRAEIPEDIRAQFGDSALVTPIDYGFVNINYDRAAEGAPPARFEDLLRPEWRGKLVVQDPATSSPGLQFLASTVAHFGEGGWQQFWRDLRANDVLVVDGWSEAYYTHFTPYGGDRTLVVSYTTSPAAEVFFAEAPVEEPPTVNVIPGPLFRQVEAAGVLRGTRQPELARAFIDFMLGDAFQSQIPETMFVYPVIPGLDLPEWWRWAEVDVQPATLDVTDDEVERWVREWTEIMRR